MSTDGRRSSAHTPRSGRILTRPENLHCVVFHLAVLAAYAAAFWIWHHPDAAGLHGPWETAAFVLAAGFLLGWISGVDVGVNFHNHTHRRIFRQGWLNDWFGRLWTVPGGWPAFFWEHAHVHVHHAGLLGPDDWTLPRRRADGRFESLYVYVLLHWPWRYARHLWRDFASGRAGPSGGGRRRALGELAFFLCVWSLPFWLGGWQMGLCLWLFPQWVANAVTMGSGMYAQHAGAVPATRANPVKHSNTFVSPFFNLTMFNIGYHIEHHDFPGVHWADLPAFHERQRRRLLDGSAHVVPYGYYRAATILSRLDQDAALAAFAADQHPDYPRRR